MNRRTTGRRLLAVVAGLSLVAAACGGDDDGETSAPPVETATGGTATGGTATEGTATEGTATGDTATGDTATGDTGDDTAVTGDTGDMGSASGSGTAAGGDPIPVGILHSLSGTMAISEVAVHDAELLAIKEINAAGGVLGREVVPIVEDGASDWPTFAEKAEKLIKEDGVAAVFGGWTSASRKAMLPVFEREKALLYYPVQYEGLEASPYIYYSGATTNQQIVPGLDYLKDQGVKTLFLVGSDYVFPKTANQEIIAYAAANGIEIVGEEYTPLGHTEYATLVNKVLDAEPDAVFNTLNGDSNVAFFKELTSAGVTAEDMPVLSVSVAEEEIGGIGVENIVGQPVAWNYFQTTDTPENEKFVAAFKAEYGEDRVTSDPVEAAYINVYIWAAAVEAAGTTEVEAVKAASGGITIQAPGGTYTVNGENHHISKIGRVGVVNADGLIDEVWSSGEPIEPDPFLENYDWWEGS